VHAASIRQCHCLLGRWTDQVVEWEAAYCVGLGHFVCSHRQLVGARLAPRKGDQAHCCDIVIPQLRWAVYYCQQAHKAAHKVLYCRPKLSLEGYQTCGFQVASELYVCRDGTVKGSKPRHFEGSNVWCVCTAEQSNCKAYQNTPHNPCRP
jgi:hypothetical protein